MRPRFNPMDFILDHEKNMECIEKIHNLDHYDKEWLLLLLLSHPISSVSTWAEVAYGLDVCRATNSSHLETY